MTPSRCSERDSLFSLGVTSNRFLIWSVLGTLALQLVVIYWAPAQVILGTEPLGAFELTVVLLASTGTFLAIELEKLILRRRSLAVAGTPESVQAGPR